MKTRTFWRLYFVFGIMWPMGWGFFRAAPWIAGWTRGVALGPFSVALKWKSEQYYVVPASDPPESLQ